MKTTAIAEALVLHTLRHKGFLAFLVLASVLILSLTVTTLFGLGRELLFIREAGFATLYLASFLACLLAATFTAGRDQRRWTAESRARHAAPASLAWGKILQANLVGLWTALALFPVLVASLALFHGHRGAGLVALVASLAPFALAPLASKLPLRPFVALALAPLPGALVSGFLIAALPDAPFIALTALAAVPGVLLASTLAGASASLLAGPAGAILGLGVFLLGNMRPAFQANGPGAWAASLLPDLASQNPALLVTRAEGTGLGTLGGRFLYTALVILALGLVASGAESLKYSGRWGIDHR